MAPSPGDFQPAVTASLAKDISDRQGALLTLQRSLDDLDAEIAAQQSGLKIGSTLELICGLTGAPLWMQPEGVVGVGRRAMASPPVAGEASTRWLCMGERGPRPVCYRDTILLWNPKSNGHLVPTWEHNGVMVKSDSTDHGRNTWLQFRFIDPQQPERSGPIAQGAAVAIEWCHNLDDPARFLRPIIRDGYCFLERWSWDARYPELYTFYLRLLPEEPPATANQRRALTTASTIRLRNVETGRPVWVCWASVSDVENRLIISPENPAAGFISRFRIMQPDSPPDAPLTYGSCVALRGLDPVIFGNVETAVHLGIYTGNLAMDEAHLFRLVPPSEDLNGTPISDGGQVRLESARGNFSDAWRYLTLIDQSGCTWLHRERLGIGPQLFALELCDTANAAQLQWLTAERAERSRQLGEQQELLAKDAANRRAAVSMRFDGRIQLTVPSSPALVRLATPSTLTVEVRAFLEDASSYWSCILSKGPLTARDYHIWATSHNQVVFFLNFADGSGIEVQTPPAVIGRRRWHLISCVVDVLRMQVTVYVDGQAQAGRTLTRQQMIAGLRNGSTAPLYFGRGPEPEDAQVRLKGYIDEVRVFNAARKPAEILGLLDGYASGREPGLVGCWRLGEQRQGRVPDITFGGNDAVIG